MKNRASSHLFIILVILGFEIAGYIAVHRAGLLRGYETSIIGAVRDLLLFIPIIALVLWLSRAMKFAGNWVLFTTAILLFSIGMLVQYRLYSDPEYNARNKAAAREEKTDALRLRYINEHYDAKKRTMMGLGPAPPPGKAMGIRPVIVQRPPPESGHLIGQPCGKVFALSEKTVLHPVGHAGLLVFAYIYSIGNTVAFDHL